LLEFFEKVTDSLREFIGNLDATRKIGLVALTGLIIAVLAVIVFWAARTQFRVLYTELNSEDATTIARLLEEEKISYHLEDDGKTILVPEDKVESFRLKMATQGVSFSGTVGYEVFDNQSFGTTSFVQNVNKTRAKEGELTRTIMHLRGVKRARVHLSIPEESPFVAEKKPPGGSVVLDLERGVSLTQAEVQGIGQLVSSSVDGMRPEHVVILDSRGKKLSENIGDEMTAHTANRLMLESKYNRSFETQIEEILQKVVGEGKVIAKVSVKLDFTEAVSTETKYDQENTAVLSEVNNNETVEGSRPSPQGIPGARSNLPGEEPQPGIPETKNNVNKNLTTKNYNVPSKVTKSKKPTANVSNISVAVMVDGKYIPILDNSGAPVVENGVAKTQYQAWTEADLKNFEQIVVSTLGFEASRGDQITIRSMEFAREDLAAAEALMRQRENREIVKNLIKYLAIGLALCLFFFLVVRPFIQWITENTIESVEDFLPKTIEELERVQANQKLPGLEDALPQIEETLNPEKIEGNMLKEKIVSLIESNPSKAAQIVHEWIHSTDSEKQIA
jgi:flagellar M-ring protein FliF